MTSSALLPWGLMVADYERLADLEEIPSFWRPTDPNADAQKAWKTFKGSLIADIGTTLWPAYSGPGSWDTEAERMLALTRADFELFISLRPCLDRPVNGPAPKRLPHHHFFRSEDTPSDTWGLDYSEYDAAYGISGTDLLGMADLLDYGMEGGCGTLPQQLKRHIQRPRPNQTAFWLGIGGFSHEPANCGFTPSMISGHCLQGSMAGCNVYFNWFIRQTSTMASLEALQQFSVDTGDRRVFAGVHYPSDNLSSWYVAFRLIPHLYPDGVSRRLAQFLWTSITKKSEVYRQIRDYICAAKQRSTETPYNAAVAALRKAAAAAGATL